MFGIGTIVNVALTIAGGILGMLAGTLLSESLKNSLIKVTGICTLFIGISGALEKMLSVNADGTIGASGTMLIIISVTVGTVVGELCHIEDGIEIFGKWLKVKTGNAKDKRFVEGFVTASLTVCIGAMAVVGSIQDGIMGDYSILVAKGVLDFIIVMIMAASMGKGCIFSAIPIALFQGSITVIAHFAGANVGEDILNVLSMVGSVLIFCVGVNLVWGKMIKVANMLPALVIAVIMACFGFFVS